METMPRPLYKSVITIWSEFDPGDCELEYLAREATVGDAFCSMYSILYIENPLEDADWVDTEFFGEIGEDYAYEQAD